MKLNLRRGRANKVKRPKLSGPDDQMTIVEHLGELRARLIRIVLAVTVGIVIVVAFYDPVLRFLLKPYNNLCERRGPAFCVPQLITLGPLEGLSTRLSIGTYGGIVLALPVIMWQVWRFVTPALHAKEKRLAVPFVVCSVLLFALGAFLAFWTLDKALDFLIAWSGDQVRATYQVSAYVSLVGVMIAAFGVAFQFPVLLVFLQLVGVLTPQTLLRGWRYAIMIIFVIAAVITPSGDPWSMLGLAVPMTVFYLVSIGIGLVVQRRRARAAASAP